jgi:4-hydroxy-3-methylbut-2-en-1-yl diphosphate synthase IspG/GcpE
VKLVIGGNHPIWVQSLTTTATKDTEATKNEIRGMLDAGVEIVRISCFDIGDSQGIGAIKKFLPPEVPLVVDIHFNYKFALEAIKQGADKVRLNPGNVGGKASVFDDEAKRRNQNAARQAENATGMQRKLRLHEQVRRRAPPRQIVAEILAVDAIEIQRLVAGASDTVIIFVTV